MSRIRVVIAGVPELLSEIVTGWLGQCPDIEVAGRTRVRDDLASLVASLGADVVVVACRHEEVAEIGDRLLAERMPPRVLAITDGGRNASLYEVRPRTVALGEATPDGLVAVIRGSGRSAPPPQGSAGR